MKRNGGPAGSRQVRSRTLPTGPRNTGGSGRRALNGWMTICEMFRKRGKSMATGNIMASKEQELVLTRVFDAPRELVFKARTDPKQVAQWWRPHGFSNPVCELDLRPGAAIRIHKRGPDGTVYPMTGDHEIVKPERLVFTRAALGADGSPLFEVLTTMTFAESKMAKRNKLCGRAL